MHRLNGHTNGWIYGANSVSEPKDSNKHQQSHRKGLDRQATIRGYKFRY